ncbi:hypothetical protein GCM10025857_28360 [Alicyclobacillus contaminans]|uniref:hypothetical protein n=1 Tax=Alicyclobacillus contaminans TaxID=392016 RepID=UPI000405CB1C|nr:hypothetical protein [Alicyclobacillus contaminans]GMA51479.1 hypothetical protein GCM10025857_28360 [Alicyclobacillus contaminans]
MYHPLYPVACRMIGRPVIAHHISGRRYHGVLQSVTRQGIYLMPTTGSRLASASEAVSATLADNTAEESVNAAPVFAPAAFFGFGALTGLTLGALAFGPGYYW